MGYRMASIIVYLIATSVFESDMGGSVFSQGMARTGETEATVSVEAGSGETVYENDADEGYAGTKMIRIWLESQRMYLVENGVVTHTYPISTGAPQTPTPQGSFEVFKKEDLRISKQGVPYRMPNYISFTKSNSHGIHALPYLGASPDRSGYWHEALEHIGTPVSHGCVRLLPEDSAVLYEWAEMGVPVEISL